MKEPAVVSPFAALSHQEQKEQWICWQCQRGPKPIEAKPTVDDVRSVSLPELKLPTEESSKPTESPSKQTEVARPRPYHGQYDAVIRKMKQAQRQTGAYASWGG